MSIYIAIDTVPQLKMVSNSTLNPNHIKVADLFLGNYCVHMKKN